MKNTNKLLGLLLVGLLAWPVASRAATRARNAVGHTFLSLDGVSVGPLAGITQTNNGLTVKLAPSELHGKPLAEWLAGSLSGRGPIMDRGAVVFTDYNYKQYRRLRFRDATLSEIDFPAFSGSSQDPVYVTLKLRVREARSVKATGKVAPARPTSTLGSQFMFVVPGVDTSYVTWVRLSNLIPRNRSSYRLVLSMQHRSFKSFQSWYSSGRKKDGGLVIGGPSGVVFTLRLRGLHVSRATWSSASRTGSAALTFDSVATR